MEKITYQGKQYPIRWGKHNTSGMVIFGTESLNKAIFDNETGKYKDDEAKAVDGKIYAFVDDNVLETYTDEKFNQYINTYYD